MVIQTNEKEFKGKTLQEYLEWKYPTKEDKEWVRKIDTFEINNDREKAGIMEILERGKLDLREFINLTKLNCFSNKLTSLDVSDCVNLTELNCSNNKLTSLDVSGCVDLTYLNCFYNNLTSLDVSGCVKLTKLYCFSNKLTSLDVSGCVKLTLLNCHSNKLTSSNVSGCVKLTELNCSNNKLTSLDVSGCVDLTKLDCHSNELTSLDVSENVDLTELYCSNNDLTSLDVSENVNLTKLYCSYNDLTSLDVSENVDLTHLICSYNKLTSVDFLNQLPHPEKLLGLDLANNNIERTNLEFLRPFVNLFSRLTLGNDKPKRYNNDIYNRFYGSLEPLRNMTKLLGLFIDGTDIEEGIEYLPVSISSFNCSPRLPNKKVAQIQDQLRLFDYDIAAWQLAHPKKMLISHPEYFTNPDSKEKWTKTLVDKKITQSQQELQEIKTNLPEKVKKIAHLESNIENLLEELSIEIEHSQDINNWYQRQLGGENAQKRNDLQEQQPKEIQEKGIQTDLNLTKINELEHQDLQNKEELQNQIEQPPKQ